MGIEILVKSISEETLNKLLGFTKKLIDIYYENLINFQRICIKGEFNQLINDFLNIYLKIEKEFKQFLIEENQKLDYDIKSILKNIKVNEPIEILRVFNDEKDKYIQLLEEFHLSLLKYLNYKFKKDDTSLIRDLQEHNAEIINKNLFSKYYIFNNFKNFIEEDFFDVPTIDKFLQNFFWVIDSRFKDLKIKQNETSIARNFIKINNLFEHSKNIFLYENNLGLHVIQFMLSNRTLLLDDLFKFEELIIKLRVFFKNENISKINQISGIIFCDNIDSAEEFVIKRNNLKKENIQIKIYNDIYQEAKNIFDESFETKIQLEKFDGSQISDTYGFKIQDIQECQFPSEILVKIFEKFETSLTVSYCLGKALYEIGFNLDHLVDLLVLIKKMMQIEEEQHPVSTSILILNKNYKNENLNLKLLSEYSLKDIDDIINYSCRISDCCSGCVVINFDGKIIGQHYFIETREKQTEFLPLKYNNAIFNSKKYNSLIFLFLGKGRVLSFYEGKLFLVHRKNKWAYFDETQLNSILNELSSNFKTEINVIKNILGILFEMSDRGKGTIITIGDHDKIVEKSEDMDTKFSITKELSVLNDNDINAITGLLLNDGATIINHEGKVIKSSQRLQPPTGLTYKKIGNTRHHTTSHVSKYAKTIACVVSQDGPITIFEDGDVKIQIHF